MLGCCGVTGAAGRGKVCLWESIEVLGSQYLCVFMPFMHKCYCFLVLLAIITHRLALLTLVTLTPTSL